MKETAGAYFLAGALATAGILKTCSAEPAWAFLIVFSAILTLITAFN